MSDNIDTSASADNSKGPGWSDLLLLDDVAYGKCPNMKSDQLERVERSASELLGAIVGGLAAVADLQSIACANPDWEPETNTFMRLGLFQKAIAELMEDLHVLYGSASFRLMERKEATASSH